MNRSSPSWPSDQGHKYTSPEWPAFSSVPNTSVEAVAPLPAVVQQFSAPTPCSVNDFHRSQTTQPTIQPSIVPTLTIDLDAHNEVVNEKERLEMENIALREEVMKLKDQASILHWQRNWLKFHMIMVQKKIEEFTNFGSQWFS